jgi:polyphosphate kinase
MAEPLRPELRSCIATSPCLSRPAIQTLSTGITTASQEEPVLNFCYLEHWSSAQRSWAEDFFKEELLPLLTPIALDPVHPFPRVINKSLNFVVQLHGK